MKFRRGQTGAPWKVLEFSLGTGVAADGELIRYEDVRLAEWTPQETEDGRIVLRFQDGSFKDPFISRFVSDGTIKMFTYLLLLKDPEKHALLCVEEPENQLYPQLLFELAEEFRLYSEEGGQVFISTHSPDFLNAVRLEELYLLVKKDGYTQIHKASECGTIRELYRAGDQLGQLWRQGLLSEEVSGS